MKQLKKSKPLAETKNRLRVAFPNGYFCIVCKQKFELDKLEITINLHDRYELFCKKCYEEALKPRWK